MRFVPGPTCRSGGRIIGLDGIRDAYLTGRGSFRTRATARIEYVTPRRKGIVVTELPYLVGPEKVIEKIKDLVQSKKLQGIADVKDLTDRKHGLRLVIEVKNGFNPDAVLEQLYRLTPMEDSFGINNVALVDGQPRTLGLKDLLRVYVDFRTRRRPPPHRVPPAPSARSGCTSSRACSSRSSTSTRSSRSSATRDDAAAGARARLIDVFDLSEVAGQLHPRPAAAPAHQVLPARAREGEDRARASTIEELEAILGDEKLLRKTRVRPSWPTSPRPTARRGAPCCSSPPGVRRHERPRRSRSPTTRAGCCCPRPGCWPGPASADPLPVDGAAVQARRRRRRRAHHRARRGRAGHLPRPDGPAVRARAAHACRRRTASPSLSGGAPLAAYVDLPRARSR